METATLEVDHKAQDISNQNASALKSSMLAQVGNIALTFAKTYVFTLFIAPEHFGLIALSITVTALIQLLRDFGYSTYIVQKKSFVENELAFINTRVICLGTLAFLIVLAITYPVYKFYTHVELLWIMPLTALQFIMNSFVVVPMALLRKEFQFAKIAKIEILANFFSIIVGLVLLLFMRNYWVLLATLNSNFILLVIFTFYYSKWKCRLVNPLNKELSVLSKAFGTYITISNAVTFISYNIDRLIIGKISGNAALGVYSKSYDLGVSNMERITYPLQKVYFSSIAKNPESEKNILFQFIFLMNTMLLVIVGPILICINWIVGTLFTAEWIGMTDMLPPFLMGSFLAMSILFTYQLLIIKTNVKGYLGFGILKACVATLAISVAAIWGPTAVAWAYFLYQLVFFIPLCNMILRFSSFERKERYKILLNMGIIVCSSIFIVALPWLLIRYHIVNIPLALLIYIAGLAFLHLTVWPLINNYKTFKEFFKILLSRKVLTES
jgi:PST family polysaccharide transporter